MKRSNTLIDWSNEERPTFGYPLERVNELLELTRSRLNGVQHSQDMDLMRGWELTRDRLLRVLLSALEQWGDDPEGLAEEATRMLDVARKIDQDEDLPKGEKVDQFLEEVGGREKFELVFEALSCAGALHDVYMAVLSSSMLKK